MILLWTRRIVRRAAFLVAVACLFPLLAGAGEPGRICSVSLAGDEYLALLVPASRVRCVSALVDDATLSNVAGHFPEDVPRVSGRLEPLLGHEPDLVLAAPWNSQDFLKLLERSGVPFLVLDDVRDFAGVRAQLLSLATALGASPRAQELLEAFDGKLAEVDRLVAARREAPKLRVLSFSHMIVAGEGSTVDALIRRAGCVNAAREIGIHGHQKVNIERILLLDPDVLLLGFDEGESPETLLAAYPHLAKTRAVRLGQIIVLPPRLLTTVSPFLADGALELTRRVDALRAPESGR